MKERTHDPSWHRKQIILGCVMLYLLMAICGFYWVTDYEMPFKLQAIIFALGVAVPTRILMDLSSFIKRWAMARPKSEDNVLPMKKKETDPVSLCPKGGELCS